MKKLLLSLAIFVIASCSGSIEDIDAALGSIVSATGGKMPGQIYVDKSDFDGRVEVSMKPGLVYSSPELLSGSSFSLGLFWSSKLPSKIYFEPETLGIVNIKSEGGLQFNVDGKIAKLNSPQMFTNFVSTGYGKSRKLFASDEKMIKRLINADSVKVKLITEDGYSEGDLKVVKSTAAIIGFPKFLETIELYK